MKIERRKLFKEESRSSVYRMFLWSMLLLGALWIIRGVDRGTVQEIGLPTPTPTRSSGSLVAEAEIQFLVGNLEASISAYRTATKLDPNNIEAWARMARIQTYYSSLQTSRVDTLARLREANESAMEAVRLDPDDSTAAAIHAFVLDWTASQYIRTDPTLSTELLSQAEVEAVRALQLDNSNTLALIFYAEIMIDEGNLSQGEQYLSLARERGQDLMDWHRVYAAYLENIGQYNRAIQSYDRAIEIAPNYTYLHLRAGANYRQLAFASIPDSPQQVDLYEKSLDYFDRAAKINQQIGVKDPIPYLSIAKTYSQLGEFFIASRNVQKALEFRPDDADVYGQLGIVYVRSRNYEGSLPAFECALYGCDEAKSCDARYGRECDSDFGEVGVVINGLPLGPDTLVYYYTYGSVLAALSRPQLNYCPQAKKVFDQIRNSVLGTDQVAIQIIQEGEAICRILDQKMLGITPIPDTPTPTPTPGPSLTPTPTP